MLELVHLSYKAPLRCPLKFAPLEEVSFTLPSGHLAALVGAPDSGARTLVRVLAGMSAHERGVWMWHGLEVPKRGLQPGDVGYVPAEDAALLPALNVKEHVVSAALLRVAGITRRDAVLTAERLLVLCGLDHIPALRAAALEPVQRKRLLMAMALVTDPRLVVCDGFTEGLQPRAAQELCALLGVVKKAVPGRVVINATHGIPAVEAYDSVVLLHEGRVAFHGPGRAVTHYFSIPDSSGIFEKLSMRPAERWQDSWNRHRDAYYAKFALLSGGTGDLGGLGSADDAWEDRVVLGGSRRAVDDLENEAPTPHAVPPVPGLLQQLAVLLPRQWTIFRRQKGAVAWQIGALLLMPLMLWLLIGSARDAAGLQLFQIACLMGAAVPTAGGLLASGRVAWESERTGGLWMSAWLGSVALFAFVWLLAHAAAVIFTSEMILGAKPAVAGANPGLLALGALAFGMLCLGTSAWSVSTETAHARCWMLAFLNVLLCGGILAWPGTLGSLLHPLFTASQVMTGTYVAGAVLCIHLMLGVVLAVLGLLQRKV